MTARQPTPLQSLTPSPAALAARRKSERLEVASADAPLRTSTVRGGQPYTCPELRTNPLPPRLHGRLRAPEPHQFHPGELISWPPKTH